MSVLEMYYPNWRELTIHESSPVFRGASKLLATECKNYIPTFYYPDTPSGDYKNGYRCENFEKLTFADKSIDLHLSQDVMEHVFDPASAFKEIQRTLKPGGAHIFTTPLVKKASPSVCRAKLDGSGNIEYLQKPNYHGNPISEDGALVTFDWGFDICQFIFDASGLFTEMIYIDDLSRGIRAEYIEVLVTRQKTS
jgi:SAM-dependent methyltransferase